MSKTRARVFSREVKEAAVHRILAGGKVRALAAELGVWPKLLYDWWNRYERGGPEALLPPGRPRGLASGAKLPVLAARGGLSAGAPTELERIAELERKVGQQALELDVFVRALRHVKASARPSAGRGATASSPSSTR